MRSSAGRTGLAALALAALVWISFGGALRNGFVAFDDDDYVYANPQVAQGLTVAGVGWAFAAGHAANWHPLTWLAHMADVELFGLNPAGHHFTSLLLHAANAILLFLVLRGLTGRFWPALWAAALWAVHPLRTESVVWISERKDVLSTFFGLLALGAYGRAAPRGRLGWTAPFFALSLMAKPTWVTLPFVLLLLDVWPLGRRPAEPWRKLAAEKGPLFLLAALACVVTFWVQRESGAVQSFEHYAPGQRLANAAVAVADYLRAVVWPFGLAAFYPHPGGNLAPGAVGGALALLLALTVLAVAGARRRPWGAVGWLWFLGTLVPMLGLVQVGGAARADRYTYLPQIGLMVALAWGVDAAVARRGGRTSLAALAGALVLGLALLARGQTATWRDSETLFRRALATTAGNAVAHYNLAGCLWAAGRKAEALEHFEAALVFKPDHPDVLNNLAWALASDPAAPPEQKRRALELARRAVEIGPGAATLDTLAAAQAACGDFAAAAATARAALAQASGAGETALAGNIRRRLDGYEEKSGMDAGGRTP